MSSARKKKQTIVHLTTGKHFRGGERQALLLHAGLLERGYASSLVCRAGSELSRPNIRGLVSTPWAGEFDVAGLFRLRRICKSIAPSIIHCHDAHAFSHGSVIGALLSIPVIYTRRVVFPLRMDFFSRWKYRHCGVLVAVSNAVALQCRAVVPEEKIVVIPDGVECDRPIVSREEARKSLGIPEKGFIIGSVGHFTQEKNLPLLISLANALKSSNPNIYIVCVGPFTSSHRTIPGNFICVGLKPEAVNYYNAFDAYVSSSTHEGLGSALIDAVVRDIPAVAIDAGGTKDIFPDNWPLISPSDEKGFVNAVTDVIQNPQKARERAMVCGERARSMFSIVSIIDKMTHLYDEAGNNPAQ